MIHIVGSHPGSNLQATKAVLAFLAFLYEFLSGGDALFKHGSYCHFFASQSRKAYSRSRCEYSLEEDVRTCGIPGSHFHERGTTAFRGLRCSNSIGQVAAARVEPRGAGFRPQRPRRGSRHSPGYQTAQASISGRIHAIHHVRTVSHVHERRSVGRDRSRRLWRNHRGCQSPLQLDSNSYDKSRARSDMKCPVNGPILREECYALFTHPRMIEAFRLWSTRKGK